MTDQQATMIAALSPCRFGVGSFDKRFVREMAARPQAYDLSPRQDWYLRRTYYRYRKQIGHREPRPVDFDTPPKHGAAYDETAQRQVIICRRGPSVSSQRAEDLRRLQRWNDGKAR